MVGEAQFLTKLCHHGIAAHIEFGFQCTGHTVKASVDNGRISFCRTLADFDILFQKPKF